MNIQDKKALEEYFKQDPHWIERARELYCERVYKDSTASQNVPTPENLCKEMVGKLRENCELSNRSILTLNVEFVSVLGNEDITFFSDCPKKSKYIKGFYPNVKIIEGDFLKWETNMQFDNIVMNPPYQKENQGESRKNIVVWDKFVVKGLSLCKDNGYCAFIHPPSWRKPEHKIYGLISEYAIPYLKIYSKVQGREVFGVTTRFDWYILKKSNALCQTSICDEKRDVHSIALKDYSFIPNIIDPVFSKILAKNNEKTCDVLYSTYHHAQNKNRVVKDPTAAYKYRCVHGINLGGNVQYRYTNDIGGGLFGVPKIIISMNEKIHDAIIDLDGSLGTTEISFALKVEGKEEAENIKKALVSDGFKKILAYTKWGMFQIDYRMFKYFKKDFYRMFL